ncbi:hypothetical protein Y032_0722g1829 [Ancylostoma ceylanicum]|uniref:Nematode cuticle collagen N-terminal domain-containing protein n=1 Tax=Ancylostoma ceylanicum TaxID=53326 RepID=A0A016WFG3_9BILA|nr:hypothetical protein Y032_0722g1829 [Ancylostoma ceylanicum]
MGVEKPIMVVASTGAILAMIACLVAIPSLYREINEIHDMPIASSKSRWNLHGPFHFPSWRNGYRRSA